ncbi:GNAT family N-acetyltransferase [Shimazuella kribbensis]|uniref:GNAT family N-acetyltransferase n=1 Tax=Shimazuella kribbensis TaxID=139808 RepID=UPI00041D43B4|nr:GNAT family N-acetyltransferase [Shimazuella kribbensis]
MLHIRQIPASETYKMRHIILRPNQLIEDCVYQGDEEETTVHLGAFWEGKLISIGSFLKASSSIFNDGLQYQLRGMATDPQYRRQKAGSTLMAEAEKMLRAKDVELLWCNARLGVKNYYNHLGFTQVGDRFEIEPIGPHVIMLKKLNS